MAVAQRPSGDEQRLPEQRFGGPVIASRGSDHAKIVQARAGVRVKFAARLAIELQRLEQQRLRTRQIAVQAQYRRDGVQAHRGFAVRVA
jgi:hypothetical protein